MQPNSKFIHLDLEFWANVKLLNQRLGYTTRTSPKNPISTFVIPTPPQVVRVFDDEGLNYSKLIKNNKFTDLGLLLKEYMEYRAESLFNKVEPNLMTKDTARTLFAQKKQELCPRCPIPMNKQKGEKKDYSFLTGLVNMLIEATIGNMKCDYDPRELTSFTIEGFPVRTLSRRVDGAFPSVKDPLAIWEIKEYYYTTTFGSRVADGVYETQLDGWELWEAKTNLARNVKHYLIVDDHYTWWSCGRSYLCRLIDSLHMGLVTEVIFGKEVLERIPILASEWLNTLKEQK